MHNLSMAQTLRGKYLVKETNPADGLVYGTWRFDELGEAEAFASFHGLHSAGMFRGGLYTVEVEQ
jgi:hypothetical protein